MTSNPERNYREYPVDVLKEETIHAGKWMDFQKITICKKGEPENQEVWEVINRKKKNPESSVNGVVIVPLLHSKKTGSTHLILEKQFRIAMKGYVVELPAGMASPNHSTEELAIKELWEETGYRGTILEVSTDRMAYAHNFTYCTMQIVTMLVDADAPENQNPKQNIPNGELENIDIFLLPIDDTELIRTELKRVVEEEGIWISSHTYFFLLGVNTSNLIDSVKSKCK